MATGGKPIYTPETANGAKLRALLIDEGTPLVRKVFDNEVSKMNPPNLKDQLKEKESYLREFLTHDQQKIVYPKQEVAGSSENFDIALLCLLLGRLCNLKPPTTGWGRPPPDGDKSPIAWIVRLRLFRNENYAHITNTALSNTKFKKLWKELCEILIQLGGDQSNILQRKTQTIDPQHYQDTFEKLHKEENRVKDLLVAQYNHVLKKLESLEEGQKVILAEVEKQSTMSSKKSNGDNKAPIQGNQNTDEQAADRVSRLSLGDGETQHGNVLVQPSSEDATSQPHGTGESETNHNSEAGGQNSIQKQHDFSILCSKNDESWTKTNIVDKLVQQKLTGYFPPRDDVGGGSVFQYLSVGIANSRNIIVVFSPSTNLDEWFKKGYLTAEAEKLDRNLMGKVIPVLRNGLTRTNMPIELRDTAPLDAEDTNFFERLQKSLDVRQ